MMLEFIKTLGKPIKFVGQWIAEYLYEKQQRTFGKLFVDLILHMLLVVCALPLYLYIYRGKPFLIWEPPILKLKTISIEDVATIIEVVTDCNCTETAI